MKTNDNEYEEFELYDNLFQRPYKANKNKNDIGHPAPCYIRQPKYEECFAIAFLKRFNEYNDIEIHDKQTKDHESMDLICESSNTGIEVTQGISQAFRKEESDWNKPLCKGDKNANAEHIWKNQQTSFACIENAIIKKSECYDTYKTKYNPSHIDLFMYIADARIIDNEQKYLHGFHVPNNMGYKAYEDIGFGLEALLKKLNTKYRKTYIVFQNYWYLFENNKIQSNILYENTFDAICEETIKIQHEIEQ